MKRRDLIQHLERHGCAHLREGGQHTIYVNRTARKTSSVPRHREINDYTHSEQRLCIDPGVSVASNGRSTLPGTIILTKRHYLARKICRDLDVPDP